MNDRREFLKSLAVAPVLAAAGCATARPTAAVRPRPLPVDAPRNIIHLVVDGLGSGTLACADHYSQLERGRRLTWFELVRRKDVHSGVMDVRSQSSLVTDSSASSSAWGSGVRIPNGKVNQTSDGRELVTLYELLSQGGWKRGLVTTTEITHATPAGFAACEGSRGDGEKIAEQYLTRHVDLLLGGGRDHFAADKRKDKRDLLGDFKAAGYTVLKSPEDLRAAPVDRPLLGVFSGGHIPYVVDQQGGMTKPGRTPSLAAMARAALDRLRRHERFVLQVEGGRVDHGAHANDGAAAILEFISFDEAVDVCLEFQREHPDTLLVITTDHATANPALNGMGDGYNGSNKLFRNVRKMRQSSGEILKRLQTAENTGQRIARLKESTGYTASARRMKLLEPYLQKKGQPLFDALGSDSAALGQLLGNHLGISFTSSNHTSDHVPVLALGPGAERFRGFLENTEIFGHYLEFAGIRFRNPQEPLVAAVEAGVTCLTEDVESYWRV